VSRSPYDCGGVSPLLRTKDHRQPSAYAGLRVRIAEAEERAVRLEQDLVSFTALVQDIADSRGADYVKRARQLLHRA
jgi:hypothetical protein